MTSVLDTIAQIDLESIDKEINELKSQALEIEKQLKALGQLRRMTDIRINGVRARKPRQVKPKAVGEKSPKSAAPSATRSDDLDEGTQLIVDAITLHGPLKVGELSRQCRLDYGSVDYRIKKHLSLFVKDEDGLIHLK